MGVGFNDANSQGNAASQGLNLVNLRRLGTNRTLCWSTAAARCRASADLSVDLNTIPATLIERADVVAGRCLGGLWRMRSAASST
jgi:hypothetical protein